MNQSPPGRMLGGIGTLLGPPQNTQFQMVVKVIKTILPKFAASAMKEGIEVENGLNRKLTRFIDNAAENFLAQPESMEDEARGDSPAVDIGIYLKVNPDTGIDPPKITVFEGKRLLTKLPKNRRREYVIGHEENGKYRVCGGIERFKLGKHGCGLKHAGMIGYIQDETAKNWHKKINSWVHELCRHSSEPAWSEQEQLTPTTNNGRVTEYTSAVERSDSKLHLTHLWISLV